MRIKKISRGIDDMSFVSKFHINQPTGKTFSCGIPKKICLPREKNVSFIKKKKQIKLTLSKLTQSSGE